jgi:hypothetical protein
MAIIKTNAYDSSNVSGAKREQLARDMWAKNEEVLTNNPSARMIVSLVWTPRPNDHPKGVPFDDSHTAIVTGENRVTMDELEKVVEMMVLQLLGLHARIKMGDPSLHEVLERGKN